MSRLLPLLAACTAAAALDISVGRAQTFKVTRLNIGGEGGTDYVTAEPGTEGKSTIQVLDAKSMKVLALWPLAPCEGPTGIAYDRATNRIFSGCGKTSVVLDAKTGRIVATIANGDGVDALGWDAKFFVITH